MNSSSQGGTGNYSTAGGRRCYRLVRDGDRFRLLLSSIPDREPGAREVRIRVEAASLNYRDLLVLLGSYGGVGDGRVPLSDAAGTVEAVGSGVTRWREGDRVTPLFFGDWVRGPYRPQYRTSALGAERDGVLAESIHVSEDSLVRIPDHLTAEEAATLPCAGVTAWRALFARGVPLQKGDTVLVQGTGGLAIFGLQFATAADARVIVTSSSDEKLERAKALGAWGTINYKRHPAWDEEVLRLTDGQGVNHILELGGPDTYDRSINCVAPGGKIAQIGVLTGFAPRPNLARLQWVNADIVGITVGSGEHFEAMNAFMAGHRLKPVVDRVFPFEQAEAAYDFLQRGMHFGKIVVRL